MKNVRQDERHYRPSVEEWRKIIESQKKSGKSVSEWCREYSLNVKAYYRWRKKLQEDIGEERKDSAQFVQANVLCKHKGSKGERMNLYGTEIQSSPEHRLAQTGEVVAELYLSGSELRIYRGIEVKFLVELVKELRRC